MPNSQAVREPTGLEVAIVGASVRFPGASDLDAFWRLLRDGTETISFFSVEETRASTLDPIPADDPQHVRAAGVVVGIEDFDAAFFSMSPREAEATDPQHRLFLECAWEAIETAGYAPDLYAGRIGVYASAGTNTYLLNNLCANRTFLGMSNALQMIIGNDKDYLATRVSYKLNLRGPSLMVQTACSSSLVDRDGALERKVPHRFEAGTPAIASVLGLGAAIGYLRHYGRDERADREALLVRALLERVAARDHLTLVGPATCEDRCAVATFRIEGFDDLSDVARALSDSYGIMCRTGRLCAQPLVDATAGGDVLRISPYIYNTIAEIDQVFAALDEVTPLLERPSIRRRG